MEQASNELRIRTVLGRLETIIDNENDNIGHDPDFDLPTSNAHKSRCLYELAMLTRDVRPDEVPQTFSGQLGRVREKLAINAQRVSAHLEAVREVVTILKNAVQDLEADGTYSQEQFRLGYGT
ncbi:MULTISPECIES: hypothetical protein [Shinella]|jgi:hypothetical protein|uniref:Flagellar protein FlgN n=1 Tax=Shinella granuli TaxID=323621 RepID=A0A4R2CGK6_SHIGR|nr:MULTISPECIES: hypothetical protein [Shinella]ANH02885.1 hypothetical protein shn_01760 [Shinella sp. HZN7]TCN38189.1 hypothetical protein EV665_12080 [Shinella granuli]